jgi:acyl-CoA thioesterase-1
MKNHFHNLARFFPSANCARPACALAALLLMFNVAFASGAESERKTIVIVGDSIAAGHGVDPDEAFPGLLQERINDNKLPYEVVNAGVSGDTTAGGVRRMPWLLRRKMDVLVLELGGNDGLRGITPKETRSNLEKIIDLAREQNPGVQIIVAGMQMPQNMGEEYTREFRVVFPAVAKEKQTKLIPFLLEGVGGKVDLNLPDRIHPNPQGHRIIADTVWSALKPLLLAAERSAANTQGEK